LSGPAGFEAFLRSRGCAARVTRWTPLVGGRSAHTVLVDLEEASGSSRRVVVHIQEEAGPLASRTDAGRQFEILSALRSTTVAVPQPLWWSPDRGHLGNPFLVTDFVEGDVPNPWRAEGRDYLARERGGPLVDDFAARLAEIHAVPLAALPSTLEVPESFARQEMDRWARVIALSPAFANDPVLVYTEEWLRAHLPSRERRGLVHGDYRFGNLVVRDSRIIAILDWELAEIGDPLFDLAAACAPPLRARKPTADFMTIDELIGRYEAHAGAPVDRADLDFYVVLATYKIAALWVNASLEYPQSGSLSALRAGFSVLEVRPMLAGLLHLPRPGPPAGSPADSGIGEALRRVAEALEHELGTTGEGQAEILIHAVAVLNRLSRRPSVAVLVAHRNRVDRFLAALRGRLPGVITEEISLDAAFAQAVRIVASAHSGDAATQALMPRLRRLLGEAAQPEFGAWP
jgi:aminoglycoside phosphotransferase (APT) family kinase protein